MSFLDDIADTVSDVAETVGKVGLEVAGMALSPLDNITMKGLGAAMSTVSDVFGGVEIFDSLANGEITGDVLTGVSAMAGKVLGNESSELVGIGAGVAGIFQNGEQAIGMAAKAADPEFGGHLTDLMSHRTKRSESRSEYSGWSVAEAAGQAKAAPANSKFGRALGRFM